MQATANRVMENKQFWNTIQSFLTLKSFIHNETLYFDINNKIVDFN